MLRVEHLQIGDLPPLSFEVADGECLAVEGASGVGKTRLLRAIADLDAAEGLVFLDGAERAEMPASEWRTQVRYCAAEPAWWTDTPRPAFPADTDERLDRLLHCLGLEMSILDRPVALLSTGERQRLALARSLIDEPHVLLLDEPTAALDAQTAALVEELIRYHVLSGGSALVVTHDRDSDRAHRARPPRASQERRPGSGRRARGMTYVPLTALDLALAATLIIVNGTISWAFSLGLERSLAIAAVRMLLQLALAALVLKFIFAQSSPAWTVLLGLIMVVAAGIEVVSRQHRRIGGWEAWGFSTATLLFIGTTITALGVGVIIGPDPWYAPRYMLPILGMVLGNTMTAMSLVLDTFTQAASRERTAIEARLALGAHRFEALSGVLHIALRTGMMPMLNSMATTGIVALPGMMTGQILAGIDPVDAAKYQVVIMFLIASATALGSFFGGVGALLLLTDNRHRLRLDRLAART